MSEAASSLGGVSSSPIRADFLPENFRKHVDPASPVPLRMMAAKSLIPLGPADMVGALFLLTYDPEAAVREAAEKSARSLPDRITGVAFRDEKVPAEVLAYFLGLFRDREDCTQMLVLNASTPDASVADLAASCSARIAELIGQNQLRLLRHEEILRQLCQNPAASPAVLDGVCDFAVRSGLFLSDVPLMVAAKTRLFGADPAAAQAASGPTAAEVMESFGELSDEAASPMEERRALNLTQQVMRMSVSEKIKLASVGNKEARGLLLRDTNKLVAVAAIQSPRITDGEVLMVAQNRTVMDDVLRVIYQSREWVKQYQIKLALVKNPKTPLAIAMKFLTTLRESELKEISRSRNVPSAVATAAKKMVEKKNAPKKEEK